MPSRSSTPSDSSLLALHDFTYDSGVHPVEYPPDHDQSQPPTPVSTRLPRRSHARAYSLSSIEHSSISSQPRHDEEGAMGAEAEYAYRIASLKRAGDDHMDEFTLGEITVMAGSSLMVLALIVIAATLAVGKVKL